MQTKPVGFSIECIAAFLAASAILLTVGCNRTDSEMTKASIAAPAGATTVGTEIDSALITSKVKTALLGDQDVKGFDIKVETRKGVVQLGGFVDSQIAVDRAILVASRVEGVSKVENAMTVKTGTTSVGNEVDDSILTTRVKSAFIADAVVKGFDISVVTRKGNVQLTGFVENQTQIDRATSIVRDIKGVTAVENKLKLKK
jgi:hyperosmotically inducible protein